MNSKLTSIFLILIIATITCATVLAAYQLLIPTSGIVEPLTELTAYPSTIDWGNVTLGVNVSRLVDIENTGTVDFASLEMTSTPSANILDYMLIWNCTGTSLEAGYYLTANFTLTIYSASEGPFVLDIHIDGV